MKDAESFREKLLKVISSNPGLHFRELQRRTDSAVGQLEYHLYQLERGGKIVSRKDGRNLRYFHNESGTISDRRIAFFMRNRIGKEILVKTLGEANGYVKVSNSEKYVSIVNQMADEGLITVQIRGSQTYVSLKDRDALISFLKKYSGSFLDSLASAMFNLMDES